MPGGFGLFSPSELRAELGYLFTNLEIPVGDLTDGDPASILKRRDFKWNRLPALSFCFDAFPDGQPVSTWPGNALSTDFGTFTAHAGPAWRLKFLNRASIFAGAQLGVAITNTDAQIVGLVPANMDFFDEFTTTNFSYQVPVGFEYSFSRRIGVTSRYRLLGVTGNANTSTSHILEGGVIIKF